jgi:HEAT repeat protein
MNTVRMILLASLVALPLAGAHAQSDEASYNDARRALNRQRFDEAVQGFRKLRSTYPQSGYIDDSFYWEAYALERGGKLEEAVSVLDRLPREHPESPAMSDARALHVQLCSELAKRGNGACAEAVWNAVGNPDADSLQMAAMNALINMPPDRAVPLAMRVLENRKQPVEVRKQALFIIADKAGKGGDAAATRELLAKTALDATDSLEVRKQAVFWLSHVRGDETIDTLMRVLAAAKDEELAKQAIFAMSQQHSPRARDQLKKITTDKTASIELRKQALFWAAQNGGMSEADLMQTYRETPERELRDQLIFLMSQNRAIDSLIQIARTDADPEQRKKAVFWLGQQRDPRAEQLLLEILEPAGDQK